MKPSKYKDSFNTLKSSRKNVPEPNTLSTKLNIEHLNSNHDCNNATTVIEFLLFTLISKMKLKATQALALLANSNTLLIHVIIKGLKGQFDPVISWYKELFAHCESLVKLFKTDPEGLSSTFHVLDIIKSGLHSKSLEVGNWTLRLMGKVASGMNDEEMSGAAWDWFVRENGGLQVILSSITRTKDLINENLVSVLCQFGRYNSMELFTHNIKLSIQDQRMYMEFVTDLLEPLADHKLTRDELMDKGIIEFWINLACGKGDIANSNTQERATALKLLTKIWLTFPSIIEDEYSDLIIRLLQRANRDKAIGLQTTSVALLFTLLHNFAFDRNHFALLIYKTLTFALVENYQKEELRELILINFRIILEDFNTIPLNVLLDPLIKQIRSSEGITSFFNLFDLEFFEIVAKHSKLSIRNAIQVLDILAKPYVYNQVLANCTFDSFIVIANRFKENGQFGSFMKKFIKVVLSIHI